MPRIRTLKPEHKLHRKIGPLTDRQYRLWVGMITEADDEGRLVFDPGQLRALVWGYHPAISAKTVEQTAVDLAGTGLIRLYTVNGTRYADFPSWQDHQAINRKTPSRLPAYDDSRSIHGGLTESSLNTHAGSEGSEGKGTEGKGGESEGNHEQDGSLSPRAAEAPPSAAPPVFQISARITSALDRSPAFAKLPQLRHPPWWQAQVRANPGVDFAAEVLKAQAWLLSNAKRAPKSNLVRFLHNWLSRADREE